MENKKIGMIGIVNNLSTRMSSHNAGWTMACLSYFSDWFSTNVELLSNKDLDLSSFDAIIINEGVNFKKGVFNFFGGVQQRQIDALTELSKFNGDIYHVNEFADYGDLLTKRKELKGLNLNFDNNTNFSVILYTSSGSRLILGDSHSISIYNNGFAISRNDGKTLYSFLRDGILNHLRAEVNELIFYAGNIDVRFHVKRNGGSKVLKELSLELFEQIKQLKNKGIKVRLVHLLPIEDASRKIPGTGKYEGENFFGEVYERQQYVYKFNSYLDRISSKLNLEEPINWNHLKLDGGDETLSFDCMEARQSVHIRPSYYKNINQISF